MSQLILKVGSVIGFTVALQANETRLQRVLEKIQMVLLPLES